MDSKVLKALRIYFNETGVARSSVAEVLGITQGHLSSVLNGRMRMTNAIAEKLSSTYGLSLPWLLYGEGTMFPPTEGDKLDIIVQRLAYQEQRIDKLQMVCDRLVNTLIDTYKKLGYIE